MCIPIGLYRPFNLVELVCDLQETLDFRIVQLRQVGAKSAELASNLFHLCSVGVLGVHTCQYRDAPLCLCVCRFEFLNLLLCRRALGCFFAESMVRNPLAAVFVVGEGRLRIPGGPLLAGSSVASCRYAARRTCVSACRRICRSSVSAADNLVCHLKPFFGVAG